MEACDVWSKGKLTPQDGLCFWLLLDPLEYLHNVEQSICHIECCDTMHLYIAFSHELLILETNVHVMSRHKKYIPMQPTALCSNN